MTIERKLLGTSPSGGDAPDVADVFSTYLYTGNQYNAAAVDVNNGIDLTSSGDGGLVWIKNRSAAIGHVLTDTVRGANSQLVSNTTAAAGNYGVGLTFDTNGFHFTSVDSAFNYSNDYVSWTFRKKEKFFDIVTYTGNYTAGRTVSHSLGSVPAMIIVKCTSGAEDWAVYHQGSNGGTSPENYKLILRSKWLWSNIRSIPIR